MEGRSIEQDFIPYVAQLEFAHVSIEGWRDGSLTLMYIASLMVLVRLCASLPNMVEVVYTGVMTCGIDMVIDGRRSPKMFPEPFPKILAESPMYHTPVYYTCTCRLLHLSL